MGIIDFFKPNKPDIKRLVSEKNLKGLIKALQYQEDKKIRILAAEALGKTGDARIIEPLTKASQDKDWDIQYSALTALGNIMFNVPIETLIIAFKDDNWHVRLSALAALGNKEDTRAVESLISALNDKDSGIRWRVAKALGKKRNTCAVEPLISALNDEDRVVRINASDSLVIIGDDAITSLILALKNRTYNIRQLAAQSLGKIRDKQAVEPLIEALKDEESDLKETVIEALGKIGDNKATEPLIQTLKDKDQKVRRIVFQALEEIGWEPTDDNLKIHFFIAKDAWIEIVKTGESAVEPLLESLENENQNIRLNIVQSLGKIGDKRAIEPLIETLNNDENRLVRICAAESLGKLGGARAINSLISVLNDDDSDIIMKAIDSLGRIGDDRVIEPLIETLKNKNHNVIKEAISSFGKIGDKRAVEPLIEFLMVNEINPVLEDCVVETLKKIGKTSVTILCETLISKPNSKFIVARLLGKMGDNAAIEPLIELLNNENKHIRVVAYEALKELKWHPSTMEHAVYLIALQEWNEICKIGIAAVEPLKLALNNRNSTIRREAAETLEKIGWKPSNKSELSLYLIALQNWADLLEVGETIVDPLLNVVKCENYQNDKYMAKIDKLDDQDLDVREKAIEILGKLGDVSAVESLITVLKDYDYDVKEKAIDALGEIGDERAVLPLIEAFGDKHSSSIEKKAAEALKKIGKPSVFPLINFLQDKTSDHKVTVVNILGEIKDNRAIPVLVETLKWNYPYLQQAAVEALGQIGDKTAIQPLIELLKDRDYQVRRKAAEILVKLGWEPSDLIENINYSIALGKWNYLVGMGKSVIEMLIETMKHEDPEVRMKIAEVLGKIGDIRAIEVLIEALKDEDNIDRPFERDRNVRIFAAEALGKLGDSRAIEPLIETLKDENFNVRWKAAMVLGKMGDKRAAEPILKFLLNNLTAYQEDTYNYHYQELVGVLGKYTSYALNSYSYKVYTVEIHRTGGSVVSHWDMNRSENAVLQLTKIRTSISSNILHLISQIKDFELEVSYNPSCDSHTYKQLSFEKIRLIAIKELKRRGNPPYDPSAFLKQDEWMK